MHWNAVRNEIGKTTMINPLDTQTTALLVMDHQRMLVDGYLTEPAVHLAKAKDVISKARAAGMPVIYIKVGFRPGYPEVSARNMMFSGVKASARFAHGDPAAEIASEIAPTETDLVVVKHRVSAFEGTDLAMLLRAANIETLVMFGIATSGVVLSTVRQGADLDYRMVVLEDLCADNDAAVHRFLMETLLPRQASVESSSEFLACL